MDDEFDDWDRDEIVDLDGCYGDATGDPQLDQLGYQSPRRNFNPPPAPEFDWQAQDRWNKAQVEADNARWEAKRARRQAMRQMNALPPQPTAPVWQQQPTAPPVPQHGAYFERREVRVWWAPWRKRYVWQQISTWRVGGPPAGVDVVTVADVAQLPGQVRTIGQVDQSGAVEW